MLGATEKKLDEECVFKFGGDVVEESGYRGETAADDSACYFGDAGVGGEVRWKGRLEGDWEVGW